MVSKSYKKIVSVVLSIAILCSTAGCKNKKDIDIDTSISISNELDSSTKQEIQSRMIEFIEEIENMDIGIDLEDFYDNAKTLKIIVEDLGLARMASYNIDENTIVLGDKKEMLGFEHELVHVILADLKTGKRGLIDENGVGLALEEGIVELLSCEAKKEKNTSYIFSSGIVKVLSIIIGKEVIIDAINNHDNKIIVKAMANIIPTQEEALDFLQEWDIVHSLINELNKEYFETGKIDNFVSSGKMEQLKLLKDDIISKLKIYIKEYFNKKVELDNLNPDEELLNMLSILDIVDKELFVPDADIEKKGDYFLQEQVDKLVNRYRITKEEYDNTYINTKQRYFFRNNNDLGITTKNKK